MASCSMCTRAWPIFKRAHSGTPREKIGEMWSRMTEVQRAECVRSVLHREKKLVKHLAKRKNLNAYQIYLEEKGSNDEWQNLSQEEQQIYYEKAKMAREKRMAKIQSLPLTVQRQIKKIWKRTRAKKSQAAKNSRKPNAFNNFLDAKWQDIQRTGEGHEFKEVMRQCGKEWREMSEESKLRFKG